MGAIVAKRSSNHSVLQAGSSPVEEASSPLLPEQPTTAQNDGTTTVQPQQCVPPSRGITTADVSSGLPVEENVYINGLAAANSPSLVSVSPPLDLTEDTDAASLSRSSLSGGGRVSTRREIVTRCLRSLETGFGVNFEYEQLLDNVKEFHCRPGETLLAKGQNAVGVYVIEKGGLDVLSPEEDAVLCRLQVGDFCGELSSFFRIPCTAAVRAQPGLSTTVLLLPLVTLSQSSHEEEVPMYRMLKWCTKRSYVGTATMFDKLDPSLLTNTQIANCLKSPKSIFCSWSNEARNHIAAKSSPMLFNSGDVLYEVGEEPSFFFLILRGSIEFSNGVDSSGVSHLIVSSSSQGCSIGAAELLSGSRMSHTATATSPLLAVPVTLDLLTNTLNRFPNNAEKWRDIQERQRNTHAAAFHNS